VRFEAAVVLALAQLLRVVDLADRPRIRRRLLGRDWTRRWEQGVQDALAEVRLPCLTVQPTAARWALRSWRDRIEQSTTAVQQARGRLIAALEQEASAAQ
jgi:hypothetical protein